MGVFIHTNQMDLFLQNLRDLNGLYRITICDKTEDGEAAILRAGLRVEALIHFLCYGSKKIRKAMLCEELISFTILYVVVASKCGFASPACTAVLDMLGSM